MNFSERIKQLREENELTTSELAALFKKSESAIRAWETDRTKPDVDTLIRIAEHFNCTTDYLLGLSDFPNQQSSETFDGDIKSLRYFLSSLDDDLKDDYVKTLIHLYKLIGELEKNFHVMDIAFIVDNLIISITESLSLAMYGLKVLKKTENPKHIENLRKLPNLLLICSHDQNTSTSNLYSKLSKVVVKEAKSMGINIDIGDSKKLDAELWETIDEILFGGQDLGDKNANS